MKNCFLIAMKQILPILLCCFGWHIMHPENARLLGFDQEHHLLTGPCRNCGGDGHKGYFGFQDHGDEVWYRNIRVKALK